MTTGLTVMGESGVTMAKIKERAMLPQICPESINPEAWATWLVYRKRDKRKPVTARAASMQWAHLGKLTFQQQAACIDLSMRNDWTGLFPEKFGGINGNVQRPMRDNSAAGRVREAVERSRAARFAGRSDGDDLAIDGQFVRA